MDALEKRLIFVALYRRAKPLIATAIRNKLDEVALIEEKAYYTVIKALSEQNLTQYSTAMLSWSENANELLNVLGETI
ncbi:MAG: hypothetical protein LBT55_04625 [Clostridiaceae bacterium]|nr:hypothetical protein [Clostridiaceae bacterium]